MPDKERTKERREHKRYFAKNHLFAVIRSDHHQLKKIDKMSKGEIAFALLKSNPSKMGEIARTYTDFKGMEGGLILPQNWDVAYDGKAPSAKPSSLSVALNVPVEPRMFPGGN